MRIHNYNKLITISRDVEPLSTVQISDQAWSGFRSSDKFSCMYCKMFNVVRIMFPFYGRRKVPIACFLISRK